MITHVSQFILVLALASTMYIGNRVRGLSTGGVRRARAAISIPFARFPNHHLTTTTCYTTSSPPVPNFYLLRMTQNLMSSSRSSSSRDEKYERSGGGNILNSTSSNSSSSSSSSISSSSSSSSSSSRHNSSNINSSSSSSTEEPNPKKERKHINGLSLLEIKELNKLLKLVKLRDFDGAMAIFDTIKSNGSMPLGRQQQNVYNAILNVCYKKEHLGKALEILELIHDSNAKQGEAANLCLIRCYSDAGMIDEARAIIHTMMTNSVEPKLRAFQPIIQALCESANLEQLADLLNYMRSARVNVNLRPEQIVVMARMLTEDRELFGNKRFRGIFEDAMDAVSQEVTNQYLCPFLLVM
jgi:pentatricopeptide repeat protein